MTLFFYKCKKYIFHLYIITVKGNKEKQKIQGIVCGCLSKNIYVPTERGGINMSKLVIIEAGNRKGVMGAIGTDGTVYELPGMKDRILKKKREMFEKRYQSYFDKIEEFENKLEEKFTRMMLESPFHDNFITELELLIPYSCEEEKRFISDYISLVTPEANKNAEKKWNGY